MGLFCEEDDPSFVSDMKTRIGEALIQKGIGNLEVTRSQTDFVQKLNNYQVAIIVSGKALDKTTSEDEFVNAVEAFHKAGKGLFLCGQNEPHCVHVNSILRRIFNTVQLHGNSSGKNVISCGDVSQAGHFKQHLITRGLYNLFEGEMVSYPNNVPETLGVLAQSSDNQPVILYSEDAKMPANTGRVVVDCGLTRLSLHWNKAGTQRYLTNAIVWLVGIDKASESSSSSLQVAPVRRQRASPHGKSVATTVNTESNSGSASISSAGRTQVVTESSQSSTGNILAIGGRTQVSTESFQAGSGSILASGARTQISTESIQSGSGGILASAGRTQISNERIQASSGTTQASATRSQISSESVQVSAARSQISSEIMSAARTQISSGSTQISGGSTQISSGSTQISSGRTQISSGSTQITTGSSHSSTSHISSSSTQISSNSSSSQSSTSTSSSVQALIRGNM